MLGQSYTILKIQFLVIFSSTIFHLVQKQDSSSSNIILPTLEYVPRLQYTNPKYWVKTTDRAVIQVKNNLKIPQKLMWGGSGDTECYAVRCFFEFSDLLYKTIQQIVV